MHRNLSVPAPIGCDGNMRLGWTRRVLPIFWRDAVTHVEIPDICDILKTFPSSATLKERSSIIALPASTLLYGVPCTFSAVTQGNSHLLSEHLPVFKKLHVCASFSTKNSTSIPLFLILSSHLAPFTYGLLPQPPPPNPPTPSLRLLLLLIG